MPSRMNILAIAKEELSSIDHFGGANTIAFNVSFVCAQALCFHTSRPVAGGHLSHRHPRAAGLRTIRLDVFFGN